MADHRRTLRAKPPSAANNQDRIVQTAVSPATYRKLYELAKVRDVSLRSLIRETLEIVVGTR